MIDQHFIAQLEKHYPLYLKELIMGKEYQPITLRGGKQKPETTVELHQTVRIFQKHEKTEGNKGWRIQWEEWNSKKLGRQQWPSSIAVEAEEDYLHLLNKEREIKVFKAQLQLLLEWNPAIQEWLVLRPRSVLELKNNWKNICAVVNYLLNNDTNGQYLRALPVPVHTKFIQQYKKVIHSLLRHLAPQKFTDDHQDLEEALSLNRKPFLFNLRWLDNTLAIKHSSGMELFAAPAAYLAEQTWPIKQVLLVENETNLYMLPSIPGTLAICSYGKALHLLKEVNFLQQSDLYYWGDLDEEGFSMLHAIRSYYEHVKSLFMDEETLATHQNELDTCPTVYIKRELLLLTHSEQVAYQIILENNKWLEQEKLNQEYVQRKIEILCPDKTSKNQACSSN